MTRDDEGLPAARHAVEHLFGQCLLRLQANEVLMKSIVAGHQLSAPTTGIAAAQAHRAAEIRRKTMGSLVNEMMGSFLVSQGQEGMAEDGGDAPSITFKSMIAFPAEELARIEAEHRDLVLLRNTLVHHFLEQHNLRTLDACLAAQQALTDTLNRVTRAYEELRSWASDIKRAREVLADHLASPEIHDLIVHRWRLMTITQILHEAAIDLARGDWAPVDIATCRITERYPEEQPEGYGCRSWRQVIHETGRFDLQVRKVDGRNQVWEPLKNLPHFV